MHSYDLIKNPYRPGAGHSPPVLAGRSREVAQMTKLLRQGFFSSNVLVTGLRGVGKTVLLTEMRSIAERDGWIWVGNDLSESASLSEDRLAVRLMTDMAEAFARTFAGHNLKGLARSLDAADADASPKPCGQSEIYDAFKATYDRAPGLPSDRLRTVFDRLAELCSRTRIKGIAFAYDEAQCLSDRAEHHEFPMSLLIETIASMQRRENAAPCLLILCGLPQVFDALTETRTYTERMFEVMSLDRISRNDTMIAIEQPLKRLMPPLHASPDLIAKVVDMSGGYPYLIQFLAKELVDQLLNNGGVLAVDAFPSRETLERLDAGLFSARWNRTTDKQREVLRLIAEKCDPAAPDFSAQEIADLSRSEIEFNGGYISQMLQGLCDRGLLYRRRHGRYAFTIPMSHQMIARRMRSSQSIDDQWHYGSSASARTAANASAAAAAARPDAPPPKKKRARWFA